MKERNSCTDRRSGERRNPVPCCSRRHWVPAFAGTTDDRHAPAVDSSPQSKVSESLQLMPHAIVTGANRGLGLEFVRQLLARGQRVVATCRQPGRALELTRLAGE